MMSNGSNILVGEVARMKQLLEKERNKKSKIAGCEALGGAIVGTIMGVAIEVLFQLLAQQFLPQWATVSDAGLGKKLADGSARKNKSPMTGSDLAVSFVHRSITKKVIVTCSCIN